MQLAADIQARQRKRVLIALTPLIDVVFILLLFFLLASSFLQWQTIKLSTPQTQGVVKQQNSGGAVLIRVGANGVVDLNGRPIQLHEIAQGLERFLTRNPDQRVLVRPAEGVPLQPVVAILDEVKAAGVRNVSLTR